jgi:hypothetical protein
VFIRPAVSGEEIQRILRAADVLLNFSNDLDNFSPSKTFDYVATGRPIIDVVYKGREQNEVFKKYPALLEIENSGDIEADAKNLFNFIGASSEKKLKNDQIGELYSEYMLPTVVAELIGRLNEDWA